MVVAFVGFKINRAVNRGRPLFFPVDPRRHRRLRRPRRGTGLLVLALNRVMSMQQRRRHRQIQSRSMSIDSVARRKGLPLQHDDNPQGGNTSARRKGSPCQQHDNLLGGKRMRYSVPELPELPKDIWHDILSRLPLRDAAQAGCVSHTFLSSLGCRPNLTFTEETVGLNGKTCGRVKLAQSFSKRVDERDKLAQIFSNRVDNIMRKHSGTGVKTFMLRYCGSFINASYLNRWLQIAITPGIEEITFSVPRYYGVYYNFPCPLLFNGSGNSIRHLNLSCCAFHPMAGLGCLTRLHLSEVDITGDELGQLLSNSLAMEVLILKHCHKIISLTIPCLLHRLNYLKLFECRGLKVIENKAPNVCVVHIDGSLEKLRVGDLLHVKELEMVDPDGINLVHHARAKLPFIMPNLQTLNLTSTGEMLSTPSLAAKFLYLRNLQIFLGDADHMRGFFYDYFSLVYFLDACPVVEDFVLCVTQTRVRHDLISAEDSHLRRMPEHRHGSLKNVKIIGFCAAKSLVELTCHILENATSLECLTLDAIYDNSSRLGADRSVLHNKYGECRPVTGRHMIAHAHKGLSAIGRYVVEKVPPTVKLDVKKLCSRCHKIK
uniref:Uncharacterized protein n=1 Tax=Avena sativa TaxID=4498 RepID=A0ACD5Y0P7_AVESA